MIGDPDAPLTMVEFTDLQCPFCRHFYMTTFERLKTAYINTNKLRYVSRDFPLEAIHPLSLSAARAARCAGTQGRFWEMRHTILKNNAALTLDVFLSDAAALQLDSAAIQGVLRRSERPFAGRSIWIGPMPERAGVTGTPSFVARPDVRYSASWHPHDGGTAIRGVRCAIEGASLTSPSALTRITSSALGNLHARVDRQRRPALLVRVGRSRGRFESLAAVQVQLERVAAAIHSKSRSPIRAGAAPKVP